MLMNLLHLLFAVQILILLGITQTSELFYSPSSSCKPKLPECTWKQVFDPLCYPSQCRFYSVKTMKEQLRQNVFGQRSAIDRIASLLHNHVENMGNYKRLPLVLHFAGDNGVGKSMSGKVLSISFIQF